jgi:hypothetical protein
LGKVIFNKGIFYFNVVWGNDVPVLYALRHKKPDFLLPKTREKEGIHMRITQTPSMKQAQRLTAFLFTMVQVVLVLSLYWVLKTHIV